MVYAWACKCKHWSHHHVGALGCIKCRCKQFDPVGPDPRAQRRPLKTDL